MRFVSLLLAAWLACAADWPRFRGVNGSGVAQGNPPILFGPEKNVAWKAATPLGKSSPIVIGDKVLLTGHAGDSLITLCFDSRTGEELWRRSVMRRNEQKRHKLNDAAAPTPTADHQRVISFFTEFGLVAYDLSGTELWRKPLDEMASMQGVSASPVIYGDSVYLVVDQAKDSYVMALRADNGEVRWRKSRADSAGGIYSSPIVFEGGGEPVLGVIGDVEFTAYSLQTGERVWWVTGLPAQGKTSPAADGERIVLSINAMAEPSQIPTFDALLAADANGNGALDWDEAKGVPRAVFPTVDANGDKKIDEQEFLAFRQVALQPSATISIRPKGRGDLSKSGVEWRSARAVPNVPSPLLAGGLVYTVRNGGLAGIYDAATGEVRKEFRLNAALGDYYASPVASSDHVYFASMEGKITIVEQGRDGKIVATIPMGEEIFATPAIVGDTLFVRTQSALYCFRIAV